MGKKYLKEDVLLLLREKHNSILSGGENRLPARSDFTDEEVVAVKAHFGAWPRALEAAGVKDPRSKGSAEKSREKRIRSKKRIAERRRESSSKKPPSH